MKNLTHNTEPTHVFGSTLKKLQKTVTLGVCAIAPLAGTMAVAQAAPAGHGPAWGYDSARYERRGNWGNNRRNDRRHQQSFVGRVTDVHSAQSFDIRVGDRVYNVYLDSRLPRRLNVRDLVRVYGDRSGSNDIRNASVTILDNR